MRLIGIVDLWVLALAISLDAFAVMVIEGSMLHRIKHLDLLKVGVFFGSWQTIVFTLSNAVTQRLLGLMSGTVDFQAARQLLVIAAVALFIILGIVMFWKRISLDSIVERRQNNLDINRILYLAAITSFDSLVAGIGVGMLGISVYGFFLPFTLFSVLAVVTGVFVGYWFGFEFRKVAYNVSCILLFVISLDLII